VLDRELQDKSSVADTQTKSVMCLPVLTAGRTLGVLYADTRSLVRPFTREHLAFAGAVAAVLGSLLQQLRTIDELQEANRALHRRLEGDDLIGASPRMIETRETLQRFAKGQAPVLITGEPGTGKELAAQRLHRLSPRAAKPLIKVSCADFPKDLIESELFGHVRGGFTSSTGDRLGLFRLADGGTLLLDEIAELPLPLQSKLLRVLESGEIRPVGSDKVHKVDVRIITATNRDLRAMMTRGEFRQDLYDRIKVLRVELPRLADHKEDIPELCAYFLANLRGEFATLVECFSPDALARLQAYTWPGNVRELRSVVIRALYNCEETTILPEHLSGLDEPETVDVDEAELPSVDGPLNREMETLEKARIRAALEKHRWNRSRAAAELGIARKTLLAKVKKYNL
jgi:transcriptional regulator with GAF, ATPase, and Fis domain